MGEREAANDLASINQYRTKIFNVAERHGQEPSLVAAIISRESSGGQTLVNGKGDGGRAFGLMQIDEGNSGITPVGAWNSEQHLDQATKHLSNFQDDARRRFPGWSDHDQKRAALAGYNMGLPDANCSPGRVDDHTHHGNYSSDVLERQAYYKRNGY